MTDQPDVAATAFIVGTDTPRNVIEALRAVMHDLPGIGRDSKAAESMGGYPYRGIEQITQHTQALFAKHGVVFVPRVLQETWQREPIQVGGKDWHDDRVQVEYDVYGPGGVGDKITVGPIPAIGRDGADKGANKCMTQAYKYALLQTLNIADKADDADSGSPLSDGQEGGAFATPDQTAALRELIKQATDAQLADELLATGDDGVKIVMGVPVWSPYTDDSGYARLRLLPKRGEMAALIDAVRDAVQAATDPTGLVGPPDEPAEPGPAPASQGPSNGPGTPGPVSPATEPAQASEAATGPGGGNGQTGGADPERPVTPVEAEARAQLDRANAVLDRHKKFTDEVGKMTLQSVRRRLDDLELDSEGPTTQVRARLVDHYMDQAAQGAAFAQASDG